MNDGSTTVDQLKALVLEFSVERDWVQFHHPKDLGLALAGEVGELLDLLRFKTDVEIKGLLETSEGHRALAHELADCFWVVLRLAAVCEIDLAASLKEKVRLAGLKYPVDRAFGRSEKYTAYQTKPEPVDDLP